LVHLGSGGYNLSALRTGRGQLDEIEEKSASAFAPLSCCVAGPGFGEGKCAAQP
jgi:hypothetical protein